MAVRTYLYGLYLALRVAQRYMSRWYTKVEENSTTDQFSCFVATLEAINECVAAYLPGPPDP